MEIPDVWRGRRALYGRSSGGRKGAPSADAPKSARREYLQSACYQVSSRGKEKGVEDAIRVVSLRKGALTLPVTLGGGVSFAC